MACEVVVSFVECGDDDAPPDVHGDGGDGAALGLRRDLPVRADSTVLV